METERRRWEEEMLDELSRTMAYPATPDMSPAVLGRLMEEHRRSSPPIRRVGLIALTVVALLAGLAVAGLKDARDAVANFLGLAVEGERIETLPTPQAGVAATPLPSPLLLDQVADRVVRAEAVARTGIQPVLPSSLGEPEAFYILRSDVPVLVADYGSVEIWQMAYEGDYSILKGIVGGGDIVQQVEVNGRPGYWVSGGARIVTVVDGFGTPRAGTQRTVTSSALIWSGGGIYRRIEGADTLEAALALATEMP